MNPQMYLVISVKDDLTFTDLVKRSALTRDISFVEETQLDEFVEKKVNNGFTCFTFDYRATARLTPAVTTVVEKFNPTTN